MRLSRAVKKKKKRSPFTFTTELHALSTTKKRKKNYMLYLREKQSQNKAHLANLWTTELHSL